MVYIGAAALFALSFSGFCLFYSGVEQEAAVICSPKPVIVIDAGHGGMDGGASSSDGTLEKDITLQIARSLEKEFSSYEVDVIMTRNDDKWLADDDDRPIRARKREDLMRRKEIIDNSQADAAILIHLNSFPEDALVCGAQVFYPKENEARTDVRTVSDISRMLAESVQKSLEININDGRERKAMAKNDILLFKEVKTPSLLVECGFLSCPQEAEKLKTAEYQQLVAKAILQGVNEILFLEKKEKMQIIYSTNKPG